MRRKGTRQWLVGGWLLVTAACAWQPPPSAPPPLSYDGLTPIEGTLMTQVWVREGHTLSPYKKVMLVGADIRYRPLDPDDPAADGFPITEAQKREFEDLITEEFDRALERLRLEVVTGPGPDVLLVRGTMLDVVSRVPPPGSGTSAHLDSVGQATFVVELIDSQSNTVLVRALDTRAAATPGRTTDDEASGREAVRRLIARWADMLVNALNDLTALDELQGA